MNKINTNRKYKQYQMQMQLDTNKIEYDVKNPYSTMNPKIKMK
jgi:hypothetical protein